RLQVPLEGRDALPFLMQLLVEQLQVQHHVVQRVLPFVRQGSRGTLEEQRSLRIHRGRRTARRHAQSEVSEGQYGQARPPQLSVAAQISRRAVHRRQREWRATGPSRQATELRPSPA